MKAESSTEGPFAGGKADLVELDRDHPGFRDAGYRARRNEIARLALDYKKGEPVPRAPYSDQEHGVWREVWRKLEPLHEERGAEAYRAASAKLALNRKDIPQLADVNVDLLAATGFSMLPVAGLVSPRMFLTHLADKVFLSTQYVRHHSRPLYTPEPDVIHELVGHAATLVSDVFCELSLLFGRAMVLAPDPEREEHVTRLYWYTLEFGLVDERGGPKAYGAGLLSSAGELERCLREPELKPLLIEDIVETPYDPTDYQAQLFVADSLEQVARETQAWMDTWA